MRGGLLLFFNVGFSGRAGSESDTYRLRNSQVGAKGQSRFGFVDVGRLYGAEQHPVGTVVAGNGHDAASHAFDNALFYQVVHPAAVPEVGVAVSGSSGNRRP